VITKATLQDAVFRPFTIGTEPPVRALMVFYDGIKIPRTSPSSSP